MDEVRGPLVPDVAKLLDLGEDHVREAFAVKGRLMSHWRPSGSIPSQKPRACCSRTSQKVVALERAKTPVPHEEAQKRADSSPSAFVLEPKQVREYPDGSLAASVLGFLRAWEGDGNYGVEQYYEPELKGVDGTWEGLDDAWGVQIS